MARLLTAIVVSLSSVYLTSAVKADSPKSTLDFRLAVTEPTEGYTKQSEPLENKPIYVSDQAIITGSDIEKVSFYNDANGHPIVGFTLTDDGSKRLWDATSSNAGKRLAIMLDGKVVSAPKILQGIEREGSISGRFDDDDLLRFFAAIVLHESSGDAQLQEQPAWKTSRHNLISTLESEFGISFTEEQADSIWARKSTELKSSFITQVMQQTSMTKDQAELLWEHGSTD